MGFNELFSEHGLSLDRLKSFLDVVEAGSIVKAAGGDTNRQSQYSRQIKELETFFSAELTRRKGRRIEITEEGQRLAKLIRDSFTDLSDFRTDSKNEARRAVIAGGASVIEWLIAPAFAECRKALGQPSGPPILETHSMRSADVVRALDDGQIDFGILRADAVIPSLKSIPIGTISYCLFIPKKLVIQHQAQRRPRSDAQWDALLSKLPQARLVDGGRLRRVVDKAHQALAIRPLIVAETTSLLQLAAMVKAGHCAAILPQTAMSGFRKDEVVAIPLTGFLDYRRDMQVAYQASGLKRRGWTEQEVKALAKALGRHN